MHFKISLAKCQPQQFTRMYSPQHSDVGFKNGHHYIVIKCDIISNQSCSLLKFLIHTQHLEANIHVMYENRDLTAVTSQVTLFGRVTLKLDGWPWKMTGHPRSFVHNSIVIFEFTLCYHLETHKFYQNLFDLCDIELWPLTKIFCMEITFVHCNYSSKFYDMMTKILSKLTETDETEHS